MRHGLGGWVLNSAGQVEIEIEGPRPALDRFVSELEHDAPPLARIDTLVVEPRAHAGHDAFRILESRLDSGWQAVSPDVATCDDCLRELFDPADRRYLYPFINCTNCGPRFTIIEAMPYDRSRTTMRHFPLCPECRREYEDPLNRRFHAEPVACPVCGPRVWLHVPGREPAPGDAIAQAADLLRAGRILALKGLGGFHLACDAASQDAVARLRERKHRYGKPLALMVPDLESARRLVVLGDAEGAALASRERPIVLAQRLGAAAVADSVAPGVATLGVMLPYTPLHHLLLRAFGGALVMTSGNLSEEPIAIGNAEAIERLGRIADAFLLHDRDIRARYDDSVLRVIAGEATPFRRSRGYAPAPLALPFEAPADILAFGGHQKGAFCFIKGNRAFMGQHIGDLDNVETVDHFRASLELFQELFQLSPAVVAHDLHPDYASTRLARDWPLAAGGVSVGVQHHHAHVVSCMAEHGLTEPVIGVSYDGTGLGTDGAIWGGEILVADWGAFRRAAHLRYVPLLGGESAIRKPYRMTASYLWTLFADDPEFQPFFATIPAPELRVLERSFEQRLNAPDTSSCGRLFDAVSALLGVCTRAAYEGEPAVRLEGCADSDVEASYPFGLDRVDGMLVADPAPALQALWRDYRSGMPVGAIAAAFHNAVADVTVEICRRV
ncbi:MAG TPA: carbamoyltransferase HypF, partial [Longimicrobiales bacterium]